MGYISCQNLSLIDAELSEFLKRKQTNVTFIYIWWGSGIVGEPHFIYTINCLIPLTYNIRSSLFNNEEPCKYFFNNKILETCYFLQIYSDIV